MKELSLKEKRRKCSKCGSSPADDPTVNLHRFPQPNKANKSRCELWAKFCFPNESWRSPQFQNKLFTEHKMLCDKHFKRTSFEKQKRLCKFSVPDNDSSKELSHDKEEEHSEDEVEIKNEPYEIIEIQEHSLGTVSSPTISQPLKRKAEVSEVNDAQKKTKDTNSDTPTQEDLDDTSNEWAGITTKYDRYDDSEIYGKLLTKKLRTYEVYERNILMFKIDGLLIEHPPGFDTSNHSYSPTEVTTQKTIKCANKTTSKVKRKSKKFSKTSSASKSEVDNAMPSSPPKEEVKRDFSKTTKSQIVQEGEPVVQNNSPIIEESYTISTQVSSDPILSPVKDSSTFPNVPSKIPSIMPNLPVKVTSNKQFPPMKVTRVPNHPIKVTSSIPNHPVKVINISNKSSKSSSLPSHIPLHITIPQTKLAPITQSKFVTTSAHPKGKIVILKSKSNKYVPSSQPPILITVPSLPTVAYSSTQCDMNSLEQLSSIAANHASLTQQQIEYDELEEMVDDMNVVSHEVIL